MRYKKLLVVVLSIAMVFAFAACGSNDKGSADNGDKKNVRCQLLENFPQKLYKDLLFFSSRAEYLTEGSHGTT